MNRVRQQLRFQRHALPIFVRSALSAHAAAGQEISRVNLRCRQCGRDGQRSSARRMAQNNLFIFRVQHKGVVISAGIFQLRMRRTDAFAILWNVRKSNGVCVTCINEPFARQFSSTQAIRSAHTRSSCPSICSKLPERLKYI